MGNLDIGLAMVAARIASIEGEKAQEIRTLRGNREPNREKEDGPETTKPSLSGLKLDVIKGKLVLIPSVETARRNRGERSTRKRGEGKILHIDAAQAARQPDTE